MTKGFRGTSSGRGDMEKGTSFGSVLDEVGFRPLGRRNVERYGKRNKIVTAPHPQPRGVRYEGRSGMIVVDFVNNAVFAIPATALRCFIDAVESEIADVELHGETHLHWKRCGITLEIAMLLKGDPDSDVFTGRSAETGTEAGVDQEP